MKIFRTGKLFSSKPEGKRSFVTKIMFVHKNQRDGDVYFYNRGTNAFIIKNKQSITEILV